MTLTASLLRTGDELEDELNDAPNPKPTITDKARFGKLASLYTAFSLDFAAYGLDMCLRRGHTRIADPFSGMGTLAEAARTRPVEMRLGDISPFAVLSGAFRAAPRTDIDKGARLLETLAERIAANDERALFENVFKALAARAKASIGAMLENPSIPGHRVTSLAIYLAALSRIRLYKRLAGSNPTWIKRPGALAERGSTLEAIKATVSAARDFARQLPDINLANRTISTWSSIYDNEITPGTLDAILTSPPYANRTDYIRHYLPASELLLAAAGQDERIVRAEQIGTPLIRDSQPERRLPASVLSVLEEIRTHPSYASERYYYKGFLYYFNDMYNALARMRSWLRSGGLLVMVVQNTYYKDVQVPTSDLFIDLGQNVGFKLAGRRDWRVRHHLSHLSPHSRRVMPNRTLIESVIALNR